MTIQLINHHVKGQMFRIKLSLHSKSETPIVCLGGRHIICPNQTNCSIFLTHLLTIHLTAQHHREQALSPIIANPPPIPSRELLIIVTRESLIALSTAPLGENACVPIDSTPSPLPPSNNGDGMTQKKQWRRMGAYCFVSRSVQHLVIAT